MKKRAFHWLWLGWLIIQPFLVALGFLFVVRMLKDSGVLPMTPLVRFIVAPMTVLAFFGSLYSLVRPRD